MRLRLGRADPMRVAIPRPSRAPCKPTRTGAPVARAMIPERSSPWRSMARSNRRRRSPSKKPDVALIPPSLGRSKGITSSRSGCPSSKPRSPRLTTQARWASGQSSRRLASVGRAWTTSPSELGLMTQTRAGRKERKADRGWMLIAGTPFPFRVRARGGVSWPSLARMSIATPPGPDPGTTPAHASGLPASIAALLTYQAVETGEATFRPSPADEGQVPALFQPGRSRRYRL